MNWHTGTPAGCMESLAACMSWIYHNSLFPSVALSLFLSIGPPPSIGYGFVKTTYPPGMSAPTMGSPLGEIYFPPLLLCL